MIYEKPEITFQKFHTDAFLDNTNVLSANDPDSGGSGVDPWDDDWEDWGFESAGSNGTLSAGSNGVGGWFNG